MHKYFSTHVIPLVPQAAHCQKTGPPKMLVTMAFPSFHLGNLSFCSPDPKNFISFSINSNRLQNCFQTVHSLSNGHDSTSSSSSTPKFIAPIVATAAVAVFLFSFRARACQTPLPLSTPATETAEVNDSIEEEDKEFKAEFDKWKSKTYALTVPLKIVALRASIPPSWIKDFFQTQGKRVRFCSGYRVSLQSIFSELSAASNKGNFDSKNAMSADIVSIGDSWLSSAIKDQLIEPIKNVEEQDWFNNLSNKWKVLLCRNDNGELDPNGHIWGAPYRWGTVVIAYNTNKFRKYNLAPIEDWGDLWRPELSGKISMIDSPREVVGAVLKYMGASYNTEDIDAHVAGGRRAVLQELTMLQKHVRLFDSLHYLKSFGAGDTWVAVGWSSDIIPAAKRMSNVAVVVPKSGASLWADLWAIPASSKIKNEEIGGRIRGPTPVIHQWIEFCLQKARGSPFQQQIIPGSSPFTLEQHSTVENSQELTNGRPKLETNLIDGVPPLEILSRCEFLEPLSDKALEDYQWLVSSMQKPGNGLIKSMLLYFSSRTGMIYQSIKNV